MVFITANALPTSRGVLNPQFEARSPVSVKDDSIVFNPHEMEMNKYYLAELNGAPYLYRRISSGEVEVYGLAD